MFVDADGDRHVTTDASDQYVRRLLLSESGMTLEEVAQKANVPVGDVQRMASMLRKAETEGTAKTPAEAEKNKTRASSRRGRTARRTEAERAAAPGGLTQT